MASGKRSSMGVARGGIVLWLLAATVCYQVVYQIVMLYVVEHDLALDQECSLTAGAAMGSPQCLEVQLFRSWKRAGEDLDGRTDFSELLRESDDVDGDEIDVEEGETGLLARPLSDVTPWGHDVTEDKVYMPVPTPLPTPGSLRKQQASTTAESEVPRAVEQDSKFEALYKSVADSLHNNHSASLWAQGLTELQDDLQHKLDDNLKKHHVVDAAAKHDSSERSFASASSQDSDSLTPWARGLLDLQAHLQAEDERLPSTIRRRAHDREESMEQLSNAILASLNKTTVSSWAQNLSAIQEDFQERIGHLHDAHHKLLATEVEKHAAHYKEAQHVALEDHQRWEKQFSGSVMSLGQEMCSDPSRLHYPACAVFRKSLNKTEETKPAQSAHEQWESNFSHVAHAWLQELCQEPGRENYTACVEFHQQVRSSAEGAATTTTASAERPAVAGSSSSSSSSPSSVSSSSSPSLRGGGVAEKAPAIVSSSTPQLRGASGLRQHYEWRHVRAWKTTKDPAVRSRELLTVPRESIRSAHWNGMIPKVACVTIIPFGGSAKKVFLRNYMKYFIDNFRFQSYEGSKQLIFVYHHTDAEAAAVVKAYADGTFIRAVAARGEDQLPSTAAYRFGAWSSDADIIARWELGVWHHPERLSMQIRAMAFSKRPASVLIAEGDEAAETPAKLGRIGTLAGEVAWMREHWAPLLDEEEVVLSGAQAHHVAQVPLMDGAGL
eukprot:TRINITY_DN63767_c0_g1_i1.p1 TRINITY_DN63767_c0_g1~~TRINITY_DN63767_c0_g1_i1.p1  ORF type:complete len:722 (+),score=164.19 TRINITY_DN63767_c0_g1_i1:59-2224(+)